MAEVKYSSVDCNFLGLILAKTTKSLVHGYAIRFNSGEQKDNEHALDSRIRYRHISLDLSSKGKIIYKVVIGIIAFFVKDIDWFPNLTLQEL